jgi:hypothetical protein
VDAADLEAEIREPAAKLVHASQVVVVEVRARGEDFDEVETVGGDALEVRAREPFAVKEMRGEAEAHHRSSSTCAASSSRSRSNRG